MFSIFSIIRCKDFFFIASTSINLVDCSFGFSKRVHQGPFEKYPYVRHLLLRYLLDPFAVQT